MTNAVYTVRIDNRTRPVCPICHVAGYGYAANGQHERDAHVWVWSDDGVLEAIGRRDKDPRRVWVWGDDGAIEAIRPQGEAVGE